MSNMRLLPLLACLLFLPDISCENNSFVAVMLGLERDCINYYCRYTGNLTGHFWHPYKFLPPAVKIKPCVTLQVQYCQLKTLDECNEDPEYWRWMCNMWSVCPREEFCPNGYYCNCKKGSPYTIVVNPFIKDWLRNYFFRLAFLAEGYYKPDEIIALSNVYDLKSRPASIRIAIFHRKTVTLSYVQIQCLYTWELYLPLV
ncbi:uncharacterized protein LOC131930649 isoform X2 [Physella acuta]|uniref:uncharacterized protein LOC131930649 isoform X2 n=1 Tax=Physella acuta TaxID=109671 RepID=UPI0027DADF83|nr:uncharacterized protein LOC131930649 isoform X2 [Physella acuta]